MYWKDGVLHRDKGFGVFSGYGTDAKPSFYDPQPRLKYFISNGTPIDSSSMWRPLGSEIQKALDSWSSK